MKKLKFAAISVFLSACSTTSHHGSLVEPKPRMPNSAYGKSEKMDLERIKEIAFQSCQGPFRPPVIEPVPMLDPMSPPEALGMVYQEQQKISSGWIWGQDDFYAVYRPRAQVNMIPMEVFVKSAGTDFYELKPWKIRREGDAEGITYGDPKADPPEIVPPIDPDKIPEAGRVITEVIFGHKVPGTNSMPQMFSFRSSGYVRFSGYPPMAQGASFRLGANNIFSEGGGDKKVGENFPIIRSMFISGKNSTTAHTFVHLEGKNFCTALSIDMTPGKNSEMVVDSYWYTRQDFEWKRNPHTGLAAYSSMVFKTAGDTPENPHDEAHDSDTFRFRFVKKGEKRERENVYLLSSPKNLHALRLKDLRSEAAISLKVKNVDDIVPTEWIIANEDRNEEHYKDYTKNMDYPTRYPMRASYKVKILETNVKTGVSLYVSRPDGEYGDNVVGVSTLRQDIKKSTSVDDAVRFKYKTTAFFPN